MPILENDVASSEELPLTYNNEKSAYVLYKRRWFMIFIFIIYAANNTMQYQMYSTIADKVSKFYGIKSGTVAWTSMINLLAYIIFSIPGYFIQLRLGLRRSIILGIVIGCIGAWTKALTVNPDKFGLLLVGQAIIGITYVFVLPMVSKIAAVWFGSNEIGKASGLGMFGIALGMMLGYVIPPAVLNSGHTFEDIHRTLTILGYGIATSSSIILILVLLFFKEEPPTPPSLSQFEMKELLLFGNTGQSIKQILSNSSFIKLAVAFGINYGVLVTIATLLNFIVSNYYWESSVAVGVIGCVSVVLGTIDSLICGHMLDKYKSYRAMALIIFVAALFSLIAYTITISLNLILAFVSLVIVGSIFSPLMTMTYELAVEITYPEPENLSAGLLTLFSSMILIAVMYMYLHLFYTIAPLVANLVLVCMSALALVIMILIPINLKRLEAERIHQELCEDS